MQYLIAFVVAFALMGIVVFIAVLSQRQPRLTIIITQETLDKAFRELEQLLSNHHFRFTVVNPQGKTVKDGVYQLARDSFLWPPLSTPTYSFSDTERYICIWMEDVIDEKPEHTRISQSYSHLHEGGIFTTVAFFNKGAVVIHHNVWGRPIISTFTLIE